MGDYTGLRFAAKLKIQCVSIIDVLQRAHAVHEAAWDVVAESFPHPELDAWARVPRCSFIPFGGICYLPAEWEEQSKEGQSILADGTWKVVCSLKDPCVIELFIRGVLPILLIEPCACEVLYEEWTEPRITMIEPKPFSFNPFRPRRCVTKGDDKR